MTRKELALTLVFAGLVGLPFAGCSGGPVPIGVTGDVRGAFTGGWACACPNGATDCLLSCPDGTDGRCTNGQPYCGVTQADAGLACACANGQATCSVTCPDGSAGTCQDGTPTCGTGGGTGCACPNGQTTCTATCSNGAPGTCQNGKLACGTGTADAGTACACPNGQKTCSVTCTDGSSGTCVDGKPNCGGGNLKWYVTCGDPVCREPVDGGSSCVADSASCPALGGSCATKGQTCNDCKQGCGARVVCEDHDPTQAPFGCPISSRKFKENIGYLQPNELARLHGEAMKMRLATYNYKDMYGSPYETHLGFIIEDNPQSLAVDRGHDRVDIYGYLSMVVASMQVQQKEIDDLRAKVATCSKR